MEFLLMSLKLDGGCYLCDCARFLQANVYETLEEVVNELHDMMEDKRTYDYPGQLFLVDRDNGSIIEDLQLKFDAGCLGGLYEITFKYDNIKYKVKRGGRK